MTKGVEKPGALGRHVVTWDDAGEFCTIKRVFIFAQNSTNGREYDRSWMVRALNNYREIRARDGTLPTFHVGHCRDAFDEKPAKAYMTELVLDRGRFYADIGRVHRDTFASLARGEWPYLSVEAWHGDSRIKSVAMLGSSPPKIRHQPIHWSERACFYDSLIDGNRLIDRFAVAFVDVTKLAPVGFAAAPMSGASAMAEKDEPQKDAEGAEGAEAAEGGEMSEEDKRIVALIVQTLDAFGLLPKEGAAAAEAGAPPMPAGAAPAGFAETFAEMAKGIDEMQAKVKTMDAERKTARLQARFAELRAQGYKFDQPVMDYFSDALNALPEDKWEKHLEVMKRSGTRDVPASALDFAGSPDRPAESFSEQVSKEVGGSLSGKSQDDIAAAASRVLARMHGGK